jgi:hypothetical protein
MSAQEESGHALAVIREIRWRLLSESSCLGAWLHNFKHRTHYGGADRHRQQQDLELPKHAAAAGQGDLGTTLAGTTSPSAASKTATARPNFRHHPGWGRRRRPGRVPT